MKSVNVILGFVGLALLIVGLLVLVGVQGLSVAAPATVKGAVLSTSLNATAFPGNFSIEQAIALKAHPTGQMNLTSVAVVWGSTCAAGSTTNYPLTYYGVLTGDSTMHRWYTFPAAGTYCGYSKVTGEINQTGGQLLYNATSSDIFVTVPGTGVQGCTHLCVHVTSEFTYVTNGLTVTLQDASHVVNGTIANITWHFGDVTCNLAPPAIPASCYGAVTSHTYAANGTYTVTETVVAANATGASATSTSTASFTVHKGGTTTSCGTDVTCVYKPPIDINAQSIGFTLGGAALAFTGFGSAIMIPLSNKWGFILGIPFVAFIIGTIAGYFAAPGVY